MKYALLIAPVLLLGACVKPVHDYKSMNCTDIRSLMMVTEQEIEQAVTGTLAGVNSEKLRRAYVRVSAEKRQQLLEAADANSCDI